MMGRMLEEEYQSVPDALEFLNLKVAQHESSGYSQMKFHAGDSFPFAACLE